MTISHALAHTIIAYTRSGRSEQDSIDAVFSFMDRRGLQGFKPAVAKHVKRLLHAEREKSVVTLYTAYPLTKEDTADILQSYNTVEHVEEIIDQTLIGGFRTEYNYHYFDATTKTALTKLKQHLLHT